MPFTTTDYKRVSNGKRVIVHRDEINGCRIKYIYFCNGKVTKINNGHQRLIDIETWDGNGILQKKILEYKNPLLKATRCETALKVTEEVKYDNGSVEKYEYPANGHYSQNIVGGNQAEPYKMSSTPLGFCVIIINDFKDTYLERNSYDNDKKELGKTWKKLGFEVKFIENKSAKELLEELKKVADSPELMKHDCFVLMILSHGHLGSMETADYKHIHLSAIVDVFNDINCIALRGKPKFFPIDTCRAREDDDTEYFPVNDFQQQNINKMANSPACNDMIISYATCSGRLAKVTENKSWYVDALCKALKEPGTKEIADILRRVNHFMSIKFDIAKQWRQNTEFCFIGVSRPLYFSI